MTQSGPVRQAVNMNECSRPLRSVANGGFAAIKTCYGDLISVLSITRCRSSKSITKT
jgi:hypothetical protein